MSDKVNISTRRRSGWTEYAKSLPVDIEIYEELTEIKRKTNRTYREIVSQLLRFALDHAEY